MDQEWAMKSDIRILRCLLGSVAKSCLAHMLHDVLSRDYLSPFRVCAKRLELARC